MNTIKKISALLFVFTLGVLSSCKKDNAHCDLGNTDQPTEHLQRYHSGVFVLNEGNFSDGQGELDYICPKNNYEDNVFEKVNKKTLGNVVQDMFISGGRIYIVSQNGDKEVAPKKFPEKKKSGVGYLSIIDQTTQKLIKAYTNEELKDLQNPSHIVVVNAKVYIRDGKGVYLLDTATDKLTFIAGTEGATNKPMALVDGKVYAITKKDQGAVFIIEGDKLLETKTFDVKVSTIAKSYDGQVWLSSVDGQSSILKFDPKTDKVVKHDIPADLKTGLKAGWNAPAFAASHDTIYFSNQTTKVFRHIFKADKTEEVVDVTTFRPSAKIYYAIGADPATGLVYVNTIDAWETYKTLNNVFAIKGADGSLVKNYEGMAPFTAGFFPVANFK